MATSDTSIFTPRFWWTDDSKPVWNAIQELCRDSQMTAIFDENNVLQFYTRDYMFSSAKAVDWTFRYKFELFSKQNLHFVNHRDYVFIITRSTFKKKFL